MLRSLLQHPEEALPLVRLYIEHKKARKLPTEPNLAFCYEILLNVSRSFAVVIQQLPNPLRDAICIFYLVLRALDTIEDDMALPVAIKVPALKAFHENIYKRDYKMVCGTGHYLTLMQQMEKMTDAFLALDPTFQEVIADITRRMGHGMASFIEKEVETRADYDEYCHYVAGLVGLGLSRLFVSSGLESGAVMQDNRLANEMGLFLQKTNIIRDYLEDIVEEPPRMFWPKEIWGQYAAKLDEFKDPANRKKALQCLNHMVCNALQHVPSCLAYMSDLQHPLVFRFCAIPQVMACATLAMCYNNGKVFEGVVKMRRGRTAFILDNLGSMSDVLRYFLVYLHELEHKVLRQVDAEDPTKEETLKLVQASIKQCEVAQKEVLPVRAHREKSLLQLVLLLISAIYFFLAFRKAAGVPLTQFSDVLSHLSDNSLLHKSLSTSFLMLGLAYVFG